MTAGDASLRKTEFRAATQAVGFCCTLGATLIEITGEDRASFLNNLCTADIKSLRAGEGCELFFTNVRGKTIGYGWAAVDTTSIVLSTAPGQANTLLSHLDRYLIREDVQLVDRSTEWQQWVLVGPQMEVVCRDHWNISLRQEEFAHTCQLAEGINLRCCRIPFLGLPSFAIQFEAAHGDCLAGALRSFATECDAAIFEFLRIQSGSPRFGVDVSEENFPQEIDRDAQAISFTKGCYLGQETVARIDALGQVQRLLRKLNVIDASSTPPSGTALEIDGTTVGHITSANQSPEDDRVLALGFIRRAQANLGSRLHSAYGEVEVL